MRRVADGRNIVPRQVVTLDKTPIDTELFRQGITDAHHDSPLNLALYGHGVHCSAHVVCCDHAQHSYLACGQVHLYLGGLGAKTVGKVSVSRLAQGGGGRRPVFVKGLQSAPLAARHACGFAEAH